MTWLAVIAVGWLLGCVVVVAAAEAGCRLRSWRARRRPSVRVMVVRAGDLERLAAARERGLVADDDTFLASGLHEALERILRDSPAE